MNDCNHSRFYYECVVCWFKASIGMVTEDSPPKGDRTDNQYYKDCLRMAVGLAEGIVDKLKEDETRI